MFWVGDDGVGVRNLIGYDRFMFEVPIKVLVDDDSVQIPEPNRSGDAAADLRANESLIVPAGERMIVGTGLAVAIPEEACGLVLPRSGLAFKHGITVLNSPGLIDSGYRGEIRIILLNTSTEDFKIASGDRIAQLLIVGLSKVAFIASQDLPDGPDDRGAAGFGSSGVS